jgi:hypothetical protein
LGADGFGLRPSQNKENGGIPSKFHFDPVDGIIGLQNRETRQWRGIAYRYESVCASLSQTSTHENRADGHADFSATFVWLTFGGYKHGVVMHSSLGLT